MSSEGRPDVIDILLVEDSPGDVRLTQEALAEARVANRLHVVGDGVEALAFLKRTGRYASVPRPDIILLDLNLPKMDGRQVLAAVKSDPDLKTIPVVVLTTSDAEADILRSYNLHANCYLVKPVDVDEFFNQVRSLEGFWLAIVKLPPDVSARSVAA
jgi:two-component system, chemotaxis family, response regulator Rcp1